MKHLIKANDVVEEVDFGKALQFALSTENYQLSAKILFFEGYSSDILNKVANHMRNMEGDNESLEEAKAKRDADEAEEFGYSWNGYR